MKKSIVAAALITVIVVQTAFAVAPLVVYGATMLAAGTITALWAQSVGVGPRIAFYARRGASFFIDGANKNPQSISQNIYAIPDGSNNGTWQQLRTKHNELANHILQNPGLYPLINKELRGSKTTLPNWGAGNSFNPGLLPETGDLFPLWDGSVKQLTQTTTCEPMPSQCYQGDNLVHGQRQSAGFYCSNSRNAGVLYIWTSCRGIDSNGKSIYGNGYTMKNQASLTVNDFTPEQILQAYVNNPSEVTQAQRDLYNRLHGTNQTSLPPTSSPAHIVDPQDGSVPTYQGIKSAVDAANTVTADTDNNPPATTVPPATTTTTTTTQVRGQAEVSVDPATGARTVTIPTTTTVTDAAGNIISSKTEYFVGTYPQGMSLPAEIQQAIDGAKTTVTTSDAETTAAPPVLANPDLAVINFQPLINCKDLMLQKFPFSLVAAFVDFADDLNVTPARPEIVLSFAGEELAVNLQPFETFAYWFRMTIGMMFVVWCTIKAFELWIEG